jgi:hypothetical protein
MKSFNLWLEQLTENFSTPQLSLNQNASDPDAMVRIISAGYVKEIGIQARYGGIRNPAAVLHNKIRHDLTNYDAIRDSLTYQVRVGRMDECEALRIREQNVGKFKQMCESIIRQLPPSLEIRGNAISQEDLLRANTIYERRELRDIADEKMHNRCDPHGTNRYAPAAKSYGRTFGSRGKF